jgi:replication factor C small subunit
MLWTEKYRPSKLSDIAGQEHFVLDAEQWVLEKNMPNVLAYGMQGTGKTGAAIALAKSMLGDTFKDNFFEVNASDDRRLETVRTTIKQVAQSGTLGDAPFRIMLLDEMDGMTSDAQNALKRIMERYANNIRFIITCNDKSRIIFPLQSRCANYRFNPLKNEIVLEVIKNILDKEQVEGFADEDLARFIYDLDGDLRRAITEIQAAKASNFTLRKQVQDSLKEFDEILNLILNKKPNETLDKLHDILYGGRSVKEICLALHNSVLAAEGLESKEKFKLLRIIGETEYRSTTMTPKVIISWMVGQI